MVIVEATGMLGIIRRDFSIENGLRIWVIADNIKKIKPQMQYKLQNI